MEDFNPDQFVQDTIDGQMSTTIELIPAGEYDAILTEVGKARRISGTSSSGNEYDFAAIDLFFEINDPVLSEKIGRSTLRVKYGLNLDLDPTTGKLDVRKGKNVALGRLREAAGQNKLGQPWSFNNLLHTGPYVIVVDHVPNKNNPEVIYEQVKRVTAKK
jgi:hypothetical protein